MNKIEPKIYIFGGAESTSAVPYSDILVYDILATTCSQIGEFDNDANIKPQQFPDRRSNLAYHLTF